MASARSHRKMSSVMRADNAASIGLTEISKQMRKMRVTNQKQAEEIRRMTKQMEVLSETRGITITNVQNAFEQAALKDADQELQKRYKQMKFRAEEAESALRGHQEDKKLHGRIADLELNAAAAAENDARSQKKLAEMYERLKVKEAEKSDLEQKILDIQRAKQNALLKSSATDSQTSKMIKDLQTQVATLSEERKTVADVVQDLTWQHEKAKQREQRAVLDVEKSCIELSSKIADIADLEQRLQSLHFAYSLVEQDMLAEQKKHRDQKAQQEAADLALVQNMAKNSKKMVEQRKKSKMLKRQVLQAKAKLAASTSPTVSSPHPNIITVDATVATPAPIRRGMSNSSANSNARQIDNPPSPRSSPGGRRCNRAEFTRAACASCGKQCCDESGSRISDARMCSVCKKFYCPTCKRQNLTRRGEGIYKHPQCVGTKTRFVYPY